MYVNNKLALVAAAIATTNERTLEYTEAFYAPYTHSHKNTHIAAVALELVNDRN